MTLEDNFECHDDDNELQQSQPCRLAVLDAQVQKVEEKELQQENAFKVPKEVSPAT